MQVAVVLLVILGLAHPIAAIEQGAGAGSEQAWSRGACAVLTRELAMKVSGSVNKVVFNLPPEEEPVGKSGSICHYADITLQIDAFTPAGIESARKTAEKEWVPVEGVGDRAYFRDNKGNFAELIGWVGSRTFTIQMGVPFQSTADKMRPNVIALANGIVPRLR